jgi:hypothetical protein
MNSDQLAPPLDTLDRDLHTTAADVEALRAAAATRVDSTHLRWDWISLARQFPHLRQSRRTCEGWEEFRL